MRRRPRRRFWVEAGVGVLGAVLFVLTLFVPEWIEAIFGVDPDQRSGSLEMVIAAGLVVMTLISGLLARRERRRPTIAVSGTR